MAFRRNIWPSATYLQNRWPRSIHKFEPSISRPVTSKSVEDAAYWAGLPKQRRNVLAVGLRKRSLKGLFEIASKNRHSNKYHDPAHTEHVVRAAGLIGRVAGLSQKHQAILVLAALVHDLDHQGKRTRPGYAAQELFSFHLVKRKLGRYGVHAGRLTELKTLLMATYPSAKEATQFRTGPTGDMIDCLVDADLFQSLFAKPSIVDSLTKRLKHEMLLTTSAEDMRTAFLSARRKVGLQSAAGRWLHGALPKGYTYFNGATGKV